MIKRILIVGYGSIGKRHLSNIRGLLPNVDIRVLANRSFKETPEFADGLYNKIEEACKFNPEAAIIANPAPFHVDVAQALSNIGCQLFVEKPISNKTNGIIELIESARKNKVVIQSGYNLRFNESLLHFKSLIDEGKIGKVLTVKSEVGQYLPNWRPDSDYRYSVSARKELGGGVLLELSHELDYLRWIFGEVDAVSAILCKQSDLEIDVEDSAFITLQFASNKDLSGPVASLYMDFMRHDTTRSCVAIGAKGSLKWSALDGIVKIWKESATEWERVFHHQNRGDDSYKSELQHFLDCVSKQENPLVNAEDGLAVMRIIEAARISSESDGKSVAVDYFNDSKV
jgi:predicted dehydrogenase